MKRLTVTDLTTLLASNPYPGRGVLVARTQSGAVWGSYILTGRSAASKDRALRLASDELLVGPTTATGHDPLRHYTAATVTDDWLVFGNGEQVSQVTDRLLGGAAAVESLSGLEYEPDPPIRTSRITVLLARDGGHTAVLGAARPSRSARQSTNVMTLTVSDLEPGEAVLLTTYQSDGKTVAVGKPFEEATVNAIDGEQLADEVWSALTPEFRVAAVVLDPLKGPAAALLRSA
jgi:IMP cyclohydrolase